MSRGGSRAAATSKMERFVIIVNGFPPLTIITKRSILDVAAALDPPLMSALPIYIVIIRYLESNFMVSDVGMVVKTTQECNLLSMAMQIIVS